MLRTESLRFGPSSAPARTGDKDEAVVLVELELVLLLAVVAVVGLLVAAVVLVAAAVDFVDSERRDSRKRLAAKRSR